jgi:hypothetical protein
MVIKIFINCFGPLGGPEGRGSTSEMSVIPTLYPYIYLMVIKQLFVSTCQSYPLGRPWGEQGFR